MEMMDGVVSPPRQGVVSRSGVIKRLQCGLYPCLKVGIYLVFFCTLVFNVSFLLKNRPGEQDFMAKVELQGRAQRPFEDVKGIKVDRQPLASPRESPAKPRFIEVEVLSSKSRAAVTVNQSTVYESSSMTDEGRGIHLVVLCQVTGRVLATRSFDTYMANEDKEMLGFFDRLTDGRIIIFAVRDEGSFSLSKEAKQRLNVFGSKLIDKLSWRDMWVFIAFKGGSRIAERFGKAPAFGKWGGPIILNTRIDLADGTHGEIGCRWPNTEENKRREKFCSKFEGYGNVCSCKDPSPLTFKPDYFPNNKVSDIPVAVMASNRPFYLLRMLQSLLTANGVNPKMITVFIDGYFEGPRMVAELFGLRVFQHIPIGVKNARIAQHYKLSINTTFSAFPEAKYMILAEEDLQISQDFFSYFSQTMHLLEEDESVYCISAWNDQGYEHSSKDPSLLYRIETMPGLGWMLKRKLFVDELQPKWPLAEQQADWDMWMRLGGIRKGRECVIPDISRTYHFGSVGLNMNPYFQQSYFAKHALNKLPQVKLKNVNSLMKDSYEELMHSLVKEAVVLDHTKSPCADDFVPDTENKTYVMYIDMKAENEYTTWTQLAKPKCFKLWDLDVRGFHKAAWRLFKKGNHLVVVGAPVSPYAVYKPKDVIPIFLEDKEKKKKEAEKESGKQKN